MKTLKQTIKSNTLVFAKIVGSTLLTNCACCDRSIPFIITLIALCLSITAVTSCNFLLVEGNSQLTRVPTWTAGLFAYNLYPSTGADGCLSFAYLLALLKETPDSPYAQSDLHKFAQFGGITPCIFGFTALLLLLLSFCYDSLVSKCAWRITLPTLLILAGSIQFCSFAIFGDENSCKPKCLAEGDPNCKLPTVCTLRDGGYCALAAGILYLFIGVSMIFYPKRTTALVSFPAKTDPDIEALMGPPEGPGPRASTLPVATHPVGTFPVGTLPDGNLCNAPPVQTREHRHHHSKATGSVSTKTTTSD